MDPGRKVRYPSHQPGFMEIVVWSRAIVDSHLVMHQYHTPASSHDDNARGLFLQLPAGFIFVINVALVSRAWDIM